MSNEDFIDVPDSNPWNNLPNQAPQPQEPAQPEQPEQPAPPEQPAAPAQPVTPEQPVNPEPFVTAPAPQTVFTSEPTPPQPEPTIYDPVLNEHEPYVDVTPVNDGFEAAPSTPASSSYTPPPAEKKKTNGWVIALIVVLVLCLCICAVGVGVYLLVASGQYKIEWSYLINSALSLL